MRLPFSPNVRRVLLGCFVAVGVSVVLSGCVTRTLPYTSVRVPLPNLSLLGLPWLGPGEGDFQGLTWENAFAATVSRMRNEYPFTAWKNINWDELEAEFTPRFAAAQRSADAEAFYLALRGFLYSIPDGHVGISDEPRYRKNAIGASYGFAATRADDGQVVAHTVDSRGPAGKAGMKPLARIVTWNGAPVAEALERAPILWAERPAATSAGRTMDQVDFFARAPLGAPASVEFVNPGEKEPISASLVAALDDYWPLDTLSPFEVKADPNSAPFSSRLLPNDIGYIQLLTMGSTLATPFPERAFGNLIKRLTSTPLKGIIIDLRGNDGGPARNAALYAGHFFSERGLFQNTSVYDGKERDFVVDIEQQILIQPAESSFTGPIILIVNERTISEAETFALAMKQRPDVRVIGFTGSHGSLSITGGGIELPKGHTVFYPIGRPVDEHGGIQGEADAAGQGGVPLDVKVPYDCDVIEAMYLRGEDVLLKAAADLIK